MPSLILTFNILFGIVVLFLLNKWMTSHRLPLPPGPQCFPVIGGLLELSREVIWSHFAKYKDRYGPISSITLFGQTIVILNDRETAVDLLDKRSSIYSDRPVLTFAKMCNMTNFLTLIHYGSDHKAHRKVIQRTFRSHNSILRLQSVMEDETRHFLARTLTGEGELEGHVRSLTGAIMLKLVYGYSIEIDRPDPLLHKAEETLKFFLHAIQPGLWLVDALPFLQWMPDWMPGSSFKRTARAWRRCVDDFANRPYAFVKHQMAAGVAPSSYVSALLEQAQDEPTEYEDIYKWSAATMSAAGFDTTAALLYSFFLALVLYPEVQKKAHMEIDAVIGSNRLPTFLDRDRLPYVEATFKEVLRWHTVVPMGIPHVLMKDDVYRGYLIPKGSIILSNIWLYNHDPSNYHDPFTFKPERFLGVDDLKPEADPSNTVFGFGRRICIGKKLSEAVIFNTVAMSLATLSLGKAHNAEGKEITPVFEVTSSMPSHPKPFSCTVTARSAKAQELLADLDVDNNWGSTRSDAEVLQSIPFSDYTDE